MSRENAGRQENVETLLPGKQKGCQKTNWKQCETKRCVSCKSRSKSKRRKERQVMMKRLTKQETVTQHKRERETP